MIATSMCFFSPKRLPFDSNWFYVVYPTVKQQARQLREQLSAAAADPNAVWALKLRRFLRGTWPCIPSSVLKCSNANKKSSSSQIAPASRRRVDGGWLGKIPFLGLWHELPTWADQIADVHLNKSSRINFLHTIHLLLIFLRVDTPAFFFLFRSELLACMVAGWH